MVPSMPNTDRPFRKPLRLPNDAYTNPDLAFHVTIRAIGDSVPFKGALGRELWRSLLDEFGERHVVVEAACLMPDHLHLLVRADRESVIDWVGRIKSVTTRAAWKQGVRGKLWQPGFYDHALRAGELAATLNYIVNNPVKAGLVKEPTEWKLTFTRAACSRATCGPESRTVR